MHIVDQKLMQLRKATGLRAIQFGAILGVDGPRVHRVERGDGQYTKEQREHSLKHFKIVNMPLTEPERATAKARIQYMLECAREGRKDEANAIREELADIVNLEPIDNELPLTYRLAEIAVLLIHEDIDTAEQRLDKIASDFDKMTGEHRYRYYANMGVLTYWRRRYTDSEASSKKAINEALKDKTFTPSELDRVHFNIALSYYGRNLISQATIYLRDTIELYQGKKTDDFVMEASILLALCYIIMGVLDKAEYLLDSTLMWANGKKYDVQIGRVMHGYALLHIKKEDLKQADAYLDQALTYLKKGTEFHAMAFYRKIYCLMDAREFTKARELLKEAQNLYGSDEVLSKSFEMLTHRLRLCKAISIQHAESSDYIVGVAIPHLINMGDYLEAISYYELLELHYNTIRNRKKADDMMEAIRDLYKRCLYGNEGS